MKVLVIGMGAVGCAIAIATANAGMETAVVAREETAKAIRANGLKRTGIFDEITVPPECITVYENIDQMEVEYDYIADFGTAGGKGFIIQKNIVYPVKRGKFDRIDVNIPYDIDAFLRRRYGEDYMKLPPVEQRVNHSPVELNFGSYTKNTVIDLLNK